MPCDRPPSRPAVCGEARGLAARLRGQPGRLERLNAIAQTWTAEVLTREELAVKVGELTGSAELGDKLRGAEARCSSGRRPRPGLLRPRPGLSKSASPAPTPGSAAGRAMTLTQAMDEVTRRFLAASGPVTREDFARWWGIPSPAKGQAAPAPGRRGGPGRGRGGRLRLAADLPGLAEAEGSLGRCGCPPSTSTWSPPPSRPSGSPGPTRPHLQPQGWLSPVLLVGERMEGVWRQAVREQAVK